MSKKSRFPIDGNSQPRSRPHRLPSFLFLLAWVLATILCPLSASAADVTTQPGLKRFQYSQGKMGTIFQLIFWTTGQEKADAAAEAAWNRIDHLNKVLSDYDSDSELNRLCRMTDAGPMKEAVEISQDLCDLLVESLHAAEWSEGAFDITVGPLTRLQRQSRKTGRAPDLQLLKQARECIGWKYIRLEPPGRRVQLLHEQMQLDVGGIAKGFTSDRVVRLLQERGIPHALCGAAGDIAVGDPPPGREDWRIAIQSLKEPGTTADYVRLHNYGVSTSGDTYRSAIVDGKRYSHIVDPQTGIGLTSRIGVTTVAPKAVIADWSATAISIMGPEKGIAMMEKVPGAAARVTTLDEQGTEKVYQSQHMARFLLPKPASAPSVDPVK